MAGTTWNKGIVSNIVPKVDIPYLEDGTSWCYFKSTRGSFKDEYRSNFEVHLGLLEEVRTQIQDILKAKELILLLN